MRLEGPHFGAPQGTFERPVGRVSYLSSIFQLAECPILCRMASWPSVQLVKLSKNGRIGRKLSNCSVGLKLSDSVNWPKVDILLSWPKAVRLLSWPKAVRLCNLAESPRKLAENPRNSKPSRPKILESQHPSGRILNWPSVEIAEVCCVHLTDEPVSQTKEQTGDRKACSGVLIMDIWSKWSCIFLDIRSFWIFSR